MTNEQEILERARNLAIRLIVDGHVDSNNEGYDGVRALYQCLNGLPITGFTCDAIWKLEAMCRND